MGFVMLCSVGMFLSACSSWDQNKRIGYDNPGVCVVSGKPYPLMCTTLTKHFKINYTINETENPDELLFNGTMARADGGRLEYFLGKNESRNRFDLLLMKDGLVIDTINLSVLNDRYATSLKLSRKFKKIDFDALSVGYRVYKQR